MVNFILTSHNVKDFISDKKIIIHYWFRKNSIDVNLMTLDQAIDSGENFVYTLYPKEPWDISEHIKKFSTELVDCINSGRCNFVINDSIEGHKWSPPSAGSFNNTEIFMDYLKEEVIDPSKVIVLSQSWSYIYNDMPFRMVHWSWHESVMSENAKPIDVPRHNFAKKFLCLNMYNKQDRFYFIYQMYKNNLLEEFNFSHSKVTSEDDFDIWNIWPWTDDITEFSKTTPHIYDNIEGPYFTFIEINPKHRQDNYIYVVTESVFNNNRPYDSFDGMTRDTSEKTWKPIALKMPFIMSHQPFALKRLRDIGYKTFHTIWDESYDEIIDCNKRMTAIVDLVKSLSSREDFVDMRESCDDIVEHNFKMLKLRSPEQDMIREVSRF